MTLPTLTPCPKPDCRAPIAHYHGDSSGDIYACTAALNGRPCPHGQDSPCYAPRETAPLLVPDVDTVARKVRETCETWEKAEVVDLNDAPLPETIARAVLDLIAAHQPVWKRVEPGTLIKEGTRYRRETLNGSFWERIAAGDFLTGDGNISIDPRTVPAPEDPRVEVLAEEMEAEYPHCDDEWPCAGAERFRGAARRAIARLDAMGGEDK